MSKEWTDTVAAAEAAAQDKQNAEEIAHSRFDAVRARARAEGKEHHSTDTEEFRQWIAARHATDAAWGAWAMAMDAKPAG
jgi:hypothetical protein